MNCMVVCGAVLLRVRCAGLVALSKLPRPRLQALHLVLWIWKTLEDGHSRTPSRRLMLALPRYRTTKVCHVLASPTYLSVDTKHRGYAHRMPVLAYRAEMPFCPAGSTGKPILKPLTHAPETVSRNRCHRLNSTPGSGASFSCRCTTSNVVDCLRAPKAVNDVRSRASSRKTGAGIWRRIYGADFWSRFLERVSRTSGFRNSSLCPLRLHKIPWRPGFIWDSAGIAQTLGPRPELLYLLPRVIWASPLFCPKSENLPQPVSLEQWIFG